MVEDRGYVAQALFDRLRADGVALCVLGDTRRFPESGPPQVELAVPRAALGAMPRAVARFCQDFDLQLVQLERPELGAWQLAIAWGDELGRPHFLGARILGDYWRGARRLLRAEELLAATPDVLFAYALLDGIERQGLAAEWLSTLWQQDPRGARERIARFWPRPAERRLVAQAAQHGDWLALRAHLPRLRRALRRAVLPSPGALAGRAAVVARRFAQPASAAVAFTGRESGLRAAVMAQVARELAPLGLRLFEERGGEPRRADLRIVIEAPGMLERSLDEDALAIGRGQPFAAMVAGAERAILRWLECRVERRHPRAVVGENPPAARLLQFAARTKLPLLNKLVSLALNSDIACRIRSPILMPHPYGIVIERGATIGSRVTVMQQASLHGAPVIEDNVCIGPGARILGAVRVGRGATVGANAVVTRDVPSHCTVVGANRLLGPARPVVAAGRRDDHETVVNT